ncbi:hypothetical protein JAAARDRAFT_59793 [Jaapia argillacea MUCL 33604]|uniref:Uncharacterized protein n=1 Tax=Jaapia argillacea MUCL 33604 TaxID=933084 RepID=A0A067PPU5_9AGAM|nr:hypothetical protein JAAARDRAFT_59793 [Jaapia argillacea MUCL 33604]
MRFPTVSEIQSDHHREILQSSRLCGTRGKRYITTEGTCIRWDRYAATRDQETSTDYMKAMT